MKKKFLIRLFWLAGTLAIILASLIAQSRINYQQHFAAQQQLTRQVAIDIHAASIRSEAMGAISMLGSSSELIKSVMANPSPENDEMIRERFRKYLQKLDADVMFTVNQEGKIVHYYNRIFPELHAASDVSFRPYWQQAMHGIEGFYPSVDNTDNLRGLYISAPIQDDDKKKPIGTIVIRISAVKLDSALAAYQTPAIIVSASGIVFASNRPEWNLKLAQPLSEENKRILMEERQFGVDISQLKNLKYLPFQIGSQKVELNQAIYSVTEIPLSWPSPYGSWRLVLLDNTTNWTTLWEQLILSGIILFFSVCLYLIVQLRNRIKQNELNAVYAQQQIQLKAKSYNFV